MQGATPTLCSAVCTERHWPVVLVRRARPTASYVQSCWREPQQDAGSLQRPLATLFVQTVHACEQQPPWPESSWRHSPVW